MKSLLVGMLAIVLVLLTAATASAGYSYLSPVNPGSVAYASYYYPGGTACAYPGYGYSGYGYSGYGYSGYGYSGYGYPVVGTRFAARPVVMAVPMAAAPIIGPYPTVVARPIIAVPNTVVYPAPVVVEPRFFVPGQPVRNIIRGVLP